MCRFPSLFLALLTNSLIVTAAAAQERLSRGDHVRVWHSATCCKRPQVGTLDAVSHDSVILQVSRSGTLVGIARNAITSVERGHRDGSHAQGGAAIGLVAGVAVGFAAARLNPSHCSPGYDCIGRKFSRTIAPIGGGLLGLLVGAVVGAKHPYERWDPVALPDRVGVRITPGVQRDGRRTQLTLTLSL
jgi:hypothetical protein